MTVNFFIIYWKVEIIFWPNNQRKYLPTRHLLNIWSTLGLSHAPRGGEELGIGHCDPMQGAGGWLEGWVGGWWEPPMTSLRAFDNHY